MSSPEPGEIYYASPNGSGRHQVIIVSREELNRGQYVVVVPVTSRRFIRRSALTNCVPFTAGQFGFDVNCVAQAENITLLEQAWIDVDTGPLARLDAATMRSLVHAIGFVIDAECEPA